MGTNCHCFISVIEPAFKPKAMELVDRYGFKYLETGSYTPSSFSEKAVLLLVDEYGLSLCLPQFPELKPVWLDFASRKNEYRRHQGGGYQQSIAKAVGVTPTYSLQVLDATAGFGQDAFVLASLGCEVTLVERESSLSALLEDALWRGAAISSISKIIGRMHLIHADGIAYMKSCVENKRPDIVYLDPLFPPRKKTALSQKSMQLLQAVLDYDMNNDVALLTTALKCAKKRVVVKRSRMSESIHCSVVPHHQILGKSCRFDVYLY
jgi:16S rRNA (guanine1516-N2)-methyltransferase